MTFQKLSDGSYRIKDADKADIKDLHKYAKAIKNTAGSENIKSSPKTDQGIKELEQNSKDLMNNIPENEEVDETFLEKHPRLARFIERIEKAIDKIMKGVEFVEDITEDKVMKIIALANMIIRIVSKFK